VSVKSVSGCCGSAPIRAPLRPSSSVVRDLSPAPRVSPPEGGPRQQSVRARRPSCHLPDHPGGRLQVSKSVRTSARASVPALSVSSPRRASSRHLRVRSSRHLLDLTKVHRRSAPFGSARNHHQIDLCSRQFNCSIASRACFSLLSPEPVLAKSQTAWQARRLTRHRRLPRRWGWRSAVRGRAGSGLLGRSRLPPIRRQNERIVQYLWRPAGRWSGR
jgi:hypothetical protein